MEGALEKRAGRSGLKRWQKRWFKLQNYKLSYYKFENDISPRGTWDLRTLRKLVSPPVAPGKTSESSTFLNLHTGHRVHELRAPTVKCKRTWLAVLQVFVEYHQTPERPIPIPDIEHEAVLACFNMLENTGVKKKGIFRIPGENFKCKRVYRDLIFEGAASLKPTVEPHVVACVAKQLVRNLPETLLTNQLFDRFIRVQNTEELQVLVHYLPPKYKDILQRLSEVMALVCKNEEHTKMDSKNLAVVVGPNLMKKNENIDFADTSNLFGFLIEKYDEIFDEPDPEMIDRYPSILDLLQSKDDVKINHFEEFSLLRRDSDCSISSISTASMSVCSTPPTFGTMSSHHYSLSQYGSRRASSGVDERELETARTKIAELEDEISALEKRYREQQHSLNSIKKDHARTKAHVLKLQQGDVNDDQQNTEAFEVERLARVNAETELEEYKKKLKESQGELAELNARLQLEGPSPLPRVRSTSRQDPGMASDEGSVVIEGGSESSTSTNRATSDMEILVKRLQEQFSEMQKRAAKAENQTAKIESRLSEAMHKLIRSEKETNQALKTIAIQQETITNLNIEVDNLRSRLAESGIQTPISADNLVSAT